MDIVIIYHLHICVCYCVSNMATSKQKRIRENIFATLLRLSKFAEEFKADDDLKHLRVRHITLDELWNKFEDIQLGIEESDDDEQQSEHRERFENMFFDAKAAYDTWLTNDSSATISRAAVVPKLNLPQLQIPNFSGNYQEWRGFYDMYMSVIHDNNQISNTQKFYYLLSALKGEAHQLIENIPVTEANYIVAWKSLCERFDNNQFIINCHLKSLFEHPPITKSSVTSLRKLVSETKQHLRALENLNLPVDQWDVLIIYIISQKLDNYTRRDWEMSKQGSQITTLVTFFQFLEQRCQAFELIGNQETIPYRDKCLNMPSDKISRRINSYATTENHNQGWSCAVCKKGQHNVFQCDVFLKLCVKDRINALKSNNLCFNCLRSKCSASKCTHKCCKKCNKKHNTLIHYDNVIPGTMSVTEHHQEDKEATIDSMQGTSDHQVTLLNSNEPTQVLLSTSIVHVRDSKGNFHEARALLDSASQSSFVTSSLARRLSLTPRLSSICVSGINDTTASVNSVVSINVSSCVSDYVREVDCLVLENITCNLPVQFIQCETWNLPSELTLADPSFNQPAKVELLLGAELYLELLRQGQIKLGPHLPVLQNTVFGWIIAGKVKANNQNNQMCFGVTMCIATQPKDMLSQQLTQFWNIEELHSDSLLTKEEKFCQEHFDKTTTRDSDGRYIVKLPLHEDPSVLGNSFDQALRRFQGLERRFKSDPTLCSKYKEFMNEYLLSNHMHLVPKQTVENQVCYYMPHHPVIKESSSTTKLRVVFDASMKSRSGISLNDIMTVGPVIQQDLISIVLRFRTYAYVFTADIVKMYRQIKLDSSQTDLQRIIWRSDPNDNVEVYALSTVTYGTASAPYLATKCLNQLSQDEGSDFPLACKVLQTDFYMDDVLTGSNSLCEAKLLQGQLIELLHRAGFELRKWCSNNKELLEIIPNEHVETHLPCSIEEKGAIKTLGLLWQPIDDQFQFTITCNNTHSLTKRDVLSSIARIFDPLGLLGPVVIKAKLFLQELWSLKLEWDELIPQPLLTRWRWFSDRLFSLNDICIPRNVIALQSVSTIQLHGFSDASEGAYGACLYVRSEDEQGHVCVRLLCSKSRVAPLKQISIPRLELCGALLLSRLVDKTIPALGLDVKNIYMWTDSTIVLAWLSSAPGKWKTFVANRVSEIQGVTFPCTWHHVNSKANPADYISRGVDPKEMKNLNLWWLGPNWLTQPDNEWPIGKQLLDPSQVPEFRVLKLQTFIGVIPFDLITKYSSWNKLVRITAYLFRFINNLKLKGEERRKNNLTVTELNSAECFWFKHVQGQEFTKELHNLKVGEAIHKKSKLRSLNPFIHEDGTIRVGGRLHHAHISMDQRHPIVLPAKHALTKLLANHLHKVNLHVGPQALLATMRQRFWPLNGKNLAKQVVRQCIICFRVKPKNQVPLMGQLPAPRVVPSRPFLETGVDYCGPIMLRQSLNRRACIVKAYIAIFVCLATKAVHIELVCDLSTEAFLAALRRFISRRGRCKAIYCDNGTNFIGAKRVLSDFHNFITKQKNSDQLIQALIPENIMWHFIPPSSPHFGGIWEASVKSVKMHLRRIMGNACLVFEELYTLLTQIEACLNSRPLTAMSEDPSDLTALTPAHFLIGDSLVLPVEPDLPVKPISHIRRWKLVQSMYQQFWKRWSREYLTQLQQRTKWMKSTSNLKEDDLVIIKDDNLPPLLWKLGRVSQLHPGVDGVVRVVTVRTKVNTLLKRQVVKLYRLPMKDS